MEEIARLLTSNRIGGVPVVDDGVLVVIITHADIVGLLVQELGWVDDEPLGHTRLVAGM